MHSEQRRRQRRERQQRLRERREEHTRRAYTLLGEELDQASMSGLLIGFSEPLTALLPRPLVREAYEALLHAAALVWNGARAFEGERLAHELARAEALVQPLTRASLRELRACLFQLARERRMRHAQEPRYVSGVEVLDEGGEDWRVLVSARLLPSDEELRPSSLVGEGPGEHFIV
ncbi:hypothetical protein FGE12_04390 [Aggregicoccus sp. 17bor-14]|uniref:hypothetical protein n=1 Tax=Myxococcaceae TaxID=31 RepID=UPI00129CA215|nr:MULTISPECIES: hypothetical protein [Myxococcaceae]MBF5041615.1 hypothetical protein [Simulacricoccus sp. 17bor-14]MRI87400.1 hypothetical protein [Aggregicoccus sp. 17bor-14]